MTSKRNLMAALLLAFFATGLVLPLSVRASEAGRRNTTLALGALTGYLAYRKMWIPAAVAGVGTYAAYHNWQAQIDARHRREHRLAYLHAYRLGYTRGTHHTRHRTTHHRTTRRR